MKKLSVRNLVLSGLFLALGLLMPFLTGQIPQLGSKLLPMHLPVLLCGFIVGWPSGLAVGILTPLLRSILFGMPPMMPVALAMAFELAAYGFLAGLLYRLLPKKNLFLYANLVMSMIGGRIVWGAVSYILYGFAGTAFTWQIFLGGAFINAIPGIILQLILIPVLVMALQKAKVMEPARV